MYLDQLGFRKRFTFSWTQIGLNEKHVVKNATSWLCIIMVVKEFHILHWSTGGKPICSDRFLRPRHFALRRGELSFWQRFFAQRRLTLANKWHKRFLSRQIVKHFSDNLNLITQKFGRNIRDYPWKQKYETYSYKLRMWNWPLITTTLSSSSKNGWGISPTALEHSDRHNLYRMSRVSTGRFICKTKPLSTDSLS
jgi:hypothetical protein